MNDSPFAIGSATYPGLSKLVEEMGEAAQVVGKLMATGGDRKHWDGTDLRDRLIEELADVEAAVKFVTEANGIRNTAYRDRVKGKTFLFWRWRDDDPPSTPPSPTGRGKT